MKQPDDGLPVDDLPKLSRPARSALAEVGLMSLEQVSQWSAKDVLALHGMGPKGVRELREALQVRGMSFAGE